MHLFTLNIHAYLIPAGPQVGPGGWQPAPNQVPANCPPGLEYLAQVDQLLVKQKLEGLESNFDTIYFNLLLC